MNCELSQPPIYPYVSAKMAFKIDTILKPLIGPGGPYEGKVQVIYRFQVQPWHAMSTLTNEAGLAVRICFYPLIVHERLIEEWMFP